MQAIVKHYPWYRYLSSRHARRISRRFGKRGKDAGVLYDLSPTDLHVMVGWLGCRCVYCNKWYCWKRDSPCQLTLDHFLPLSMGGASVVENCVLCCKECNNLKGNRHPSEFLTVEFGAAHRDRVFEKIVEWLVWYQEYAVLGRLFWSEGDGFDVLQSNETGKT